MKALKKFIKINLNESLQKNEYSIFKCTKNPALKQMSNT